MVLCVDDVEDHIEWSSPSIVPGESGVDSSKKYRRMFARGESREGRKKEKGKMGEKNCFYSRGHFLIGTAKIG